MNLFKISTIVVLFPLLVSAAKTQKQTTILDSIDKDSVIRIIDLVNSHWQSTYPITTNAFWHNAAYHTGNIEAYKVTGRKKYMEYSLRWAEYNMWMGARSNNRSQWKHTYGETDDYVLFGDWQICFQIYIDLYNMDPDPRKIARAQEVMEYQINSGHNYYWWWADGLYMVMPVMTKLYKLTGNESYLEKLDQWLAFADSIMYDNNAKLYYRDSKYVYPKHKSLNGKKDFWARGDGWVFAGLAKVLQDMPLEYKSRPHYEKRFCAMAEAIAQSQQKDGYWTRSMLDSEHAPGEETSGTAFFTYGILWGINNGLLNAKTYLPVAAQGWHYLSTKALQKSGMVGYVQPIGEKAIPDQVVNNFSTANFGVGAFLLAAAELTRYIDKCKN